MLSGGSEVILPDNYILLFNLLSKEKVQKQMFIEADKHTDILIAQIRDKSLPLVKSGIGKFLQTKLSYPLYTYGRKTKHFYTLDTCNSCQLCEKICPASIITMDNGKPKWTKDRCVQCLACLHRCPSKAIQHKKRTEKRGRYINPNVCKNLKPQIFISSLNLQCFLKLIKHTCSLIFKTYNIAVRILCCIYCLRRCIYIEGKDSTIKLIFY